MDDQRYPWRMPKAPDQSPKLLLVTGDRSALEREAVRIAAMGSNAEVASMVDRLQPRGKLSVAELPAADDARSD